MEVSKKLQRIIIFVLVMVLAITGYILATDHQSQAGQPTPSASQSNVIEYQGKRYRYNTDLMNILFIGVDSTNLIQTDNLASNTNQADSIILISLNKSTKEANLLQVSRNSMVDITQYDIYGEPSRTSFAQLALQYSTAKGGAQSCWAMVDTVSTMLSDLRIDGYINLNIEAIGKINELAGPVTITIPEDYTDVDPAFVKGATITLSDGQAEAYVRHRDIEGIGSNQERMARQIQYIEALVATVRSKGDIDSIYDMFAPLLDKYLLTNMTGDQIDELADYNLSGNGYESVPGETTMGNTYEEFYINYDKLDDILIKMFYNEL
ncbi:MAG: LCP family protein [Erysipelotrichaceae bacterium]|nr:LCP family protein [Erysipelotrichaceae bacterium]MDD3810431.1 LCP family protein [Erysipelotrichaceae bacterium]